MFRVGGNSLLYGGGLLYKGKSSANFSFNRTFSLITKGKLNINIREMVWVTIHDEKVNDTVDVIK